VLRINSVLVLVLVLGQLVLCTGNKFLSCNCLQHRGTVLATSTPGGHSLRLRRLRHTPAMKKMVATTQRQRLPSRTVENKMAIQSILLLRMEHFFWPLFHKF